MSQTSQIPDMNQTKYRQQKVNLLYKNDIIMNCFRDKCDKCDKCDKRYTYPLCVAV